MILIDDEKAFKKALSYQLKPVDSMSMLLLFKKKRLIPAIQQILNTMLKNGECLSEDLLQLVLREAREVKE